MCVCVLSITVSKSFSCCNANSGGSIGTDHIARMHTLRMYHAQALSRPFLLRRHGELSRAMRNRGIEVFIVDEGVDSPRGSTAITGSDAEISKEFGSQDLMAVLALQGVPGTALPGCMVAAHLAVVQEAARYHRCVQHPAIADSFFKSVSIRSGLSCVAVSCCVEKIKGRDSRPEHVQPAGALLCLDAYEFNSAQSKRSLQSSPVSWDHAGPPLATLTCSYL